MTTEYIHYMLEKVEDPPYLTTRSNEGFPMSDFCKP